MNSFSPSRAAREFVQAFSTISSTEDLILFVAGTDGMLSYCQELMEQHDRDTPALMTMEIQSLCAELGVLPGMLYTEMRKVLIALNRFHDPNQDHYAVLGIREGAAAEEIKNAYRNLSKQYHPDLAGNDEDAAKRFMEISGAYHAIMATTSDRKSETPSPWRKKGRDRFTRKKQDRKKFIVIVTGVILTLVALTVYLSEQYDETINSTQVQAWSVQPVAEDTPLKKTAAPLPLSAAERPVTEETPPIAVISPPPLSPAAEIQPENLPEGKTPGPSNPVTAAVSGATAGPSPEKAADLPKPSSTGEDRAYTGSPSQTAAAGEPSPEKKEAVPVAVIDRKSDAMAATPAPAVQPAALTPQNPGGNPGADTVSPVGDTDAIPQVLARYTERYTRKDLEAYLALFTDNATENGHPLSSLVDRYRSLFIHTDGIDLAFDGIGWEEFRDGFKASGTFRSSYTYKDGRKTQHNGTITFHLIAEGPEGLKIQSLDYVFLH